MSENLDAAAPQLKGGGVIADRRDTGDAVEQRDQAGGWRSRAGDSPALDRPLRFSYGWRGWLRCRTATLPAVISRASVSDDPRTDRGVTPVKAVVRCFECGCRGRDGLAVVLTSALLWRPLGGTWLASACLSDARSPRAARRARCRIGGTLEPLCVACWSGLGCTSGLGPVGWACGGATGIGIRRGWVDLVKPLLWPEVKPCRGCRRGDRSDREGACDDGAAYCESHDSSCD